MPKSIPTLGLANWGQPLNEHLSQLNDPTNGGINKFDTFASRPTTLTANDIGKTYLYTQTGNIHQWDGTNWKVLNESHINVKDFGAVGDGVADDTVAIQLAINTAKGAGVVGVNNRAVYIPGGVYKITSTLEVDASFTSILSNGAILEASGFAGTVLQITTSLALPWDQSATLYEGFEIFSSTVIIGSVGVKLSGGAGVSIYHVAHLSMNQLNIRNMDKGLVFEDNVYIINIIGTFFNQCNIGFFANGTNPERYTFHNCTWGSCKLALSINSINSDTMLTTCSIDYNQKMLDLISGKVFFTDCHLEFANSTGANITVSNESGAAFVMKGGQIACGTQPNSAKTFDSFIDVQLPNTNLNRSGGAYFDGVFLTNMDTRTGFFASGDGSVVMNNTQTYFVTGFTPKAISPKSNLLADGDFTSSTIIDDIFLLNNTTTTNYNNSTSDLALSTFLAKNGSQSLQAYKINSNLNCDFMISGEVRSGAKVAFKAYVRNNTSSIGRLFYYIAFFTKDPISSLSKVKKQENSYFQFIDFDATTATKWNEISFPDLIQAPTWATHVGIYFDANSLAGPSAFYIDEVNIGLF
jgi:hypothetical protein